MEGQEAHPQDTQKIDLGESIKQVKQESKRETEVVESQPSETTSVLTKCEAQMDHSNQQDNILDKPVSFAELKQTNCETQSQRDQAQTINRYVGTSHEELISIAETNNCQANEIQSSDTIFTEEQKDEHMLGRQTLSLTESAPFQILQESSTAKKQEQSQSENIFIQAHTEEIQIQQTSSAKKEQQNIVGQFQSKNEIEEKISQSLRTILSVRKSKLKMEKILDVAHLPQEKKLVKGESIVVQQATKTEEKLEQKVEAPVAKEVVEEKKPQPEPLKIDNLFISSLRSKSQIKPPQPQTPKQSLKPWMKLRGKKSANQPVMPIVNPVETKQETTEEKVVPTAQNKSQQLPKVQVTEIKPSVQSEAVPIKQNTQLQQANNKQPQEQTVPAAQVESQPISYAPKEPQIQFHKAAHHPLEGPTKPPIQVAQSNPIQKQEEIAAPIQQQQPLLLPISQPKQQAQSLPQIQQNQYANYIQQKQSSSASSSEKQEIDINYNHNKKYQEQLHRQSKEKIKELMEKLRQQEELNRELQKSMSLPLRLLGSVLIGASTAGITWLVRRKRTESIVLGLAFTMSTFVFSS